MSKELVTRTTFVNLVLNAKKDMPALVKALYQVNNLSYHASAEQLYDEFMRNGGNSIVNFFRGGGVEYSEIFEDVAKYLKLDIKYKTTSEMRIRLGIQKMFRDVVKKHAKIVIECPYSRKISISTILPLIGTGMLLGDMFMGLGLETSVLATLAGLGIATESLGLLIPGLNIFIGAYAVKKIADPAYRKTVPSVLYTELLLYVRDIESE